MVRCCLGSGTMSGLYRVFFVTGDFSDDQGNCTCAWAWVIGQAAIKNL